MGRGSWRLGDYPVGTTWPLALDHSPPVLICTVRDGRSAVLTSDRWYDHVLGKHREMANQLPYVEWALTRPDMVCRDAWEAQRECYYVEHRSPHGRALWLKTVVHFDASVQALRGVDGYVVTAFLTNRIKRREERLWP